MGEQVAAGNPLRSPEALPAGGARKDSDGDVAQLGEHLPCKQGVKGSNPSISRGQGELSEAAAGGGPAP